MSKNTMRLKGRDWKFFVSGRGGVSRNREYLELYRCVLYMEGYGSEPLSQRTAIMMANAASQRYFGKL